MRGWWVLGGLGAALVFGGWWVLGPRPSTGVVAQRDAVRGPPPAQPLAVPPPPSRVSEPPQGWNGGAFAEHLSDTEVDGRLAKDAEGHLIVDLAVRDFFDYFLSAVEGRGLEVVLAELERQIGLRLEPPASREALRLLHAYVDYQKAQGHLLARPAAPREGQSPEYYAAVLQDTFTQLKAERRARFAPDVVDVFFGVEEAFGAYTVAAMAVKADSGLSETEKVRKLEELEAGLPEQMVVSSRRAERRGQLADEARAAFEAGRPESELRGLLSRTYTAAEVDSMLGFFRRESDWEDRWARYREAWAVLESPTDEALGSLRRKYFDAAELGRVAAEEALATRRR